MLIRFAIGQSESLEPLPSVIAGRFNLWLGREEKAGRTYTNEQREWLMAIRDHLGVNVEVRAEDLMEAPPKARDRGVYSALKNRFSGVDIFWIKGHALDDPDLLPPPDEVAAAIVESLELALDRFRNVAKALGELPQ